MKQFQNLLCIVNPENTSISVLERAVALAESNQARLSVASFVKSIIFEEGLHGFEDEANQLESDLINKRKQELDAIVDRYRDSIKVKTFIITGMSPYLEEIKLAIREKHDLLIKCLDNYDSVDRLLGADDMNLLRKCPCPVWLAKSDQIKSYKSILAAVDLGANYPKNELAVRQSLNEIIIETAASLAVSEFAELHIAHAWAATEESALRHSAFLKDKKEKVDAYIRHARDTQNKLMDSLLCSIRDRIGVDAIDHIKPKMHSLKGRARKEIPRLAEQLDVDCIVMGTVGRVGIRGIIMGNTAETILNRVNSSVLAIKPPGFVTPVSMG